jgi:hypothetical protein
MTNKKIGNDDFVDWLQSQNIPDKFHNEGISINGTNYRNYKTLYSLINSLASNAHHLEKKIDSLEFDIKYAEDKLRHIRAIVENETEGYVSDQ